MLWSIISTAFRFLNPKAGTLQIFLSITLGMLLGCTPTFITLQTPVLILTFLFIRIPVLILGVSAGGSYFASQLYLAPKIHQIGQMTLMNPKLSPLWAELMTKPIIPFFRFNNTMIMGTWVLILLLSPIILLASFFWARLYVKGD